MGDGEYNCNKYVDNSKLTLAVKTQISNLEVRINQIIKNQITRLCMLGLSDPNFQSYLYCPRGSMNIDNFRFFKNAF